MVSATVFLSRSGSACQQKFAEHQRVCGCESEPVSGSIYTELPFYIDPTEIGRYPLPRSHRDEELGCVNLPPFYGAGFRGGSVG